MPEPFLMIAMPCRNQVTPRAYASHVVAQMRAKTFWNNTVGSTKFGFQLLPDCQAAEARSLLWKKAQEMGVDWVWWIDDDMELPPDTFEQMWRATPFGDIITGFYWRKAPPFLSTIGRWPKSGSGVCQWIDPHDMALPYEEVDTIGFGCVLMRRKAIDQVGSETNDLPFLTRPGNTEDNYFCTWVRRYGYRVVAVRDLHCGHIGYYSYSYADRQAWLAAQPKPEEVAP